MTRLFGTNGIRGVVNQEMTGELALGVGKAWGTYLKQTFNRPTLVIGTDARLSNHLLKSAITSGLLASGCDVVDIGVVPTPTVQYIVQEKKFDSGVVITASHNPPQFNGIKGIAGDGIEFSKDVEEAIETIYFAERFSLVDWREVGASSLWTGAIDLYLKKILSLVDTVNIKKQRFHVVLDCSSGAGGLAAPRLLEKLECTVTKLYCEPDGTFPGHNSEPLPENLGELIRMVPEVDASFGIALDGDADRAIFIDEKGTYHWGDQTLSVIGKYITRQNKGGLSVTPVTTSTCFEEVIKEYGGTVLYTRVGSPIVARTMKEKQAVFGGEENGGLIFPRLQYCRDSSMSLATMLEILAKEKRPLSELIAEVPQYEMYKAKLKCPNNKKEQVMKTLVSHMKTQDRGERIDETDGMKLYVEDGWVLLRPSGTEPLFRVYAEAKEKARAQQLGLMYREEVEQIIQRLVK